MRFVAAIFSSHLHKCLLCRANKAGKGTTKHAPALKLAEIDSICNILKQPSSDSFEESQRKLFITGVALQVLFVAANWCISGTQAARRGFTEHISMDLCSDGAACWGPLESDLVLHHQRWHQRLGGNNELWRSDMVFCYFVFFGLPLYCVAFTCTCCLQPKPVPFHRNEIQPELGFVQLYSNDIQYRTQQNITCDRCTCSPRPSDIARARVGLGKL